MQCVKLCGENKDPKGLEIRGQPTGDIPLCVYMRLGQTDGPKI